LGGKKAIKDKIILRFILKTDPDIKSKFYTKPKKNGLMLNVYRRKEAFLQSKNKVLRNQNSENE
jgi:hypothetical protein